MRIHQRKSQRAVRSAYLKPELVLRAVRQFRRLNDSRRRRALRPSVQRAARENRHGVLGYDVARLRRTLRHGTSRSPNRRVRHHLRGTTYQPTDQIKKVRS